MGFSLIGVLLVLRWRFFNPSILKTGHFPFRYRASSHAVPLPIGTPCPG